MSKIRNLTAQHFKDLFLSKDIQGKLTDLTEILDLPLDQMKGLSKDDVIDLLNENLKTIRDLSQLTPEQTNLIKTQVHFEPEKFQNILVASRLVFLASQKKPLFTKKTSSKMICVGLDNAGKTSLINLLSGKNISDSINLNPTSMINHINISAQDIEFLVWDFGGQEAYRQVYFEKPEEFFTSLDLVIFVIDSIDSQRFDESLKYFSQFLETLTYLDENPYILVLLHKVDPDLQTDPEFQINLEYLRGRVRDLLRQVKFGREIVTSSIYNAYYSQPTIVSQLKAIFQTQQFGNENAPIRNALEKMADLIVQICNRQVQAQELMQTQIQGLSEKLTELSQTLKNPKETVILEKSDVLQFDCGCHAEAESVQNSSLKQPENTTNKIIAKNEPKSLAKENSLRSEVITELKEIFKKRGAVAQSL